MKHPHLVCLKIGGSVITDKTTLNTANQEAITSFAISLSTVLKDISNVDILLGNGVGSFGHHTAHAYNLRDGAVTAEQFYGAAVTHNAVRHINLLLADTLTAKKLPVFCLSPGDLLHAANKKVTTTVLETIETLLKNGVIPLLHGDVIADSVRGISVFSTETSLFWCAKKLRDSYEKITIITVVNTGGVLDEAGKIITELQPSDEIALLTQNKAHHDVTGSMDGKVASCREAATWADAVYIVGNSASDITRAINHHKVGTRIL